MDFTHLDFFSNKLVVPTPFANRSTMGSFPQVVTRGIYHNHFRVKKVNHFVKPPNLASNLLQSLYVFIYHHLFKCHWVVPRKVCSQRNCRLSHHLDLSVVQTQVFSKGLAKAEVTGVVDRKWSFCFLVGKIHWESV